MSKILKGQRRKRHPSARLIRYAFHEAGHAVVGHVIGRCIAEVSIVRNREQGYRGYCRFNAFVEDIQGYPQWRDGSKNPECTTILYAGTLAMKILCEQRGWNYERWREGEKSDFDNIYLWAVEMLNTGILKNENQCEAMWKQCEQEARETLTLHWRSVETLASVLLLQGKISGEEAHRIIQNRIDPNVSDWRMEGWNTPQNTVW